MGTLAVRRRVFGWSALQEGVPEWGAPEISTAGGLALSACLLVTAMFRLANPQGRVSTQPAWELLPPERRALGGVVAVVVGALAVLGISPDWFSALTREDGVIETGSFIALVWAGAWSIRLALGRSGLEGRRALVTLGLLCWLIAGEEVSWFQRLGFGLAGLTVRNRQNELNFHNFATEAAENVYYGVGGFLTLVVLPALSMLALLRGRLASLGCWSPRPAVLIAGSLAVGFNFDMIPGAPTQLAFFGTLGILASLARNAPDVNRRRLIWTCLTCTCIAQAICLAQGAKLPRSWAIEEYKELLLPLTVLVWLAGLGAARAGETPAFPGFPPASPVDRTAAHLPPKSHPPGNVEPVGGVQPGVE